MGDAVRNPAHYAGNGVECMEALRSAMCGCRDLPPMGYYWWGCVFKYVWRWPRKNGVEDLRKARQCLDYLIDEMGKEGRLSDGRGER